METIQDKIDQLKRFGYEVINGEYTIEVKLKTRNGYGFCVEMTHDEVLSYDHAVTHIVYRLNYLIKQDL